MKKLLGFIVMSIGLIIVVGCTVIDLSRDNNAVNTPQSTDNRSTTNTTTTNNGVGFNTTKNKDANATAIARIVSNSDIVIKCDLTGLDDFIYVDGYVSVTEYNTPFFINIGNSISELVTYDSQTYYKINDVIPVDDNPTLVSLDIKVTVKDKNGKILSEKVCFQPAL